MCALSHQSGYWIDEAELPGDSRDLKLRSRGSGNGDDIVDVGEEFPDADDGREFLLSAQDIDGMHIGTLNKKEASPSVKARVAGIRRELREDGDELEIDGTSLVDQLQG